MRPRLPPVWLKSKPGLQRRLAWPPPRPALGWMARLASWLARVPAIVSLLIRIPGGLLYSPRRARPLLAGALVLGALAFALYPLMHEALLLALIGAIYGIGYSIATTVSMAVTIESLRPGENRGQAIGIYAAGMSTGYALGSLVGGVSGDNLGYAGAFRLA